MPVYDISLSSSPNVTGKVCIVNPAPAGGVLVTLRAGFPLVLRANQSSVTIPAGARCANYTATALQANSTVGIWAQIGSYSMQSQVRIGN